MILYEINTRCWLADLKRATGTNITLESVPDSEFRRWRDLGFSHIWLMGVWTTGPRSREAAAQTPALCRSYAEILPDCLEPDVAGSPYAVADYQVPAVLGGERGLQHFRKRLDAHGLKLILDFVTNHVGLDHPWVSEQPELLVQSREPVEGFFKSRSGRRWIAHGKDPHFPAWIDTAQLDYRRTDTRKAMVRILRAIAQLCDGVRCDMAMLVLNDVFGRTWEEFPCPGPALSDEFWPEAIGALKLNHPQFLFLAEVYWDLEARLQELGFDFTYDKPLYEYLVRKQYSEVQPYLLGRRPQFHRASLHFLENHDEPRIASLLTFEEHRAAALVTLGLPGMRLLHEGQLTGATVRIPVELSRRPSQPARPEIAALYEQLLAAIAQTAIGRGEGALLKVRPAWPDNPTAQNFVIAQWIDSLIDFDLVVVNVAPHRSQCFAQLTVPNLEQYHWHLKDRWGTEIHLRRGDDLAAQGLFLDLPAHGAQLFHFTPAG